MDSAVSVLLSAGNQLGEGIRYDRQLDCLDWVDIPARRLHSLSAASVHTITTLGIEPGFVARTESGSRLCGGNDCLVLVNQETKQRRLDHIPADAVINDGAVHPEGNALIFGTRHIDETRPSGRMFLLTDTIKAMPWPFIVFNGPTFSPDGSVVYFTDSPSGLIWQATFDALQAGRDERQVFARVPECDGFPDGMATDADGGVWSAHWDGSRVTRYFPDGGIDRVIEVPVARPTSLTFAGKASKRLVVTGAQPDQSGGDPAEGALLELETGFTGPPSPRLAESVVQTIFAGDQT